MFAGASHDHDSVNLLGDVRCPQQRYRDVRKWTDGHEGNLTWIGTDGVHDELRRPPLCWRSPLQVEADIAHAILTVHVLRRLEIACERL